MTKKYNFKYQMTTDTNNGKGFSEDELKTTIEKSRITGGSDGLFVASIVRNNTHKPYYEVDTDFFILKMTESEMFSVWHFLAKVLSKKSNLSIILKNICASTVKQLDKMQKEFEN